MTLVFSAKFEQFLHVRGGSVYVSAHVGLHVFVFGIYFADSNFSWPFFLPLSLLHQVNQVREVILTRSNSEMPTRT